jgi:hypothetical protein
MIMFFWERVTTDQEVLGSSPSRRAKNKGFMSKRYSGKSFKDSSIMKKAKLTFKEKRKIKKEKKSKK